MKATLLLIEDSAAQGGHVKVSLEGLGYEVVWAKSGIEGLKLARSEHPDLILLDIVMQDMDGFAVCRWLKMQEDTRDIPVIMLTVKGAVEHRVEGLNVGANDYLAKPFEKEELEARIFAAMRVKTYQSELKQRNTELESMLRRVESMAITDPLTGLYNRRRFADVLRREFAVTKRYGSPLSCILMDLDHFKQINDAFGHDAGDKVLQKVASRLVESLREVDLAARFGGEEFAVLLPHTGKGNARIVGERIANFVRKLSIDVEGECIRVTASLGIAATTDFSSNNPEDLVKAADAAMYQAKEGGRDRVVLYARESELPPSAKTV